MRIVPISCLKDNYAYLLICEATSEAAVVDPSEPGPVLEAVRAEGVTLRAVWNTHHHFDHTGGNKGLLEVFLELEVVGHASDKGRVPGQTTFVEDGEHVELGASIRAAIIHNPGHTTGAISYHIDDADAVFTGDTLFGAGCGRLFEGTPEQMHSSLTRLASLSGQTQVYCGHEYTANNLRFAAAVEPGNEVLAARRSAVDELRASGSPSVPFSIADERATNPFLRTEEPAVVAAATQHEPPNGQTPVEVFAALRRWKDRF